MTNWDIVWRHDCGHEIYVGTLKSYPNEMCRKCAGYVPRIGRYSSSCALNGWVREIRKKVSEFNWKHPIRTFRKYHYIYSEKHSITKDSELWMLT